MRRRKRGAAPEEDVIPADILEEILHRLPSNDLLKFKIVCKEWLHLISSPEFIQKHLERSKAESREPHILASKDSPEIEILGYRANTLTNEKIRGMGHVRLLGSCDGLVLYYEPSSHKIGALNPSTRKIEVDARPSKPSTKNDLLHYYLVCTWFGRHPATGEYVLVIAFVRLGRNNKIIVFNVYGLSRSSLVSSLAKELDTDYYVFNYQEIGTFLHGRLHVSAANLASSRKFEILAYDLQANTMLRMCTPLPCCPALRVVDGCLCALNKSQVWMMKEYGVKESWTKYANIDDKISIPLQIYSNGDVILCDEFLEAIRDGATKLMDSKGCFMRRTVVACIDSLVSPAVVWEERE